MRRLLAPLAVAAVLISVLAVGGTPSGAAVGTDSSALRAAITPAGLADHLQAFQAIADANGGTRASGTPGYAASVDYVVDRLEAAGYSPQVQPFLYPYFQILGPASLSRVSPSPETYAEGPDFEIMEYSGSGNVTAPLQAAGGIQIPPSAAPSSSSGCAAGDFAGFTAGNIALVQRGTCDFAVKVANAAAAGASAVIIFNEGQEGRTDTIIGTLGGPAAVPALFATFDLGAELYGLLQQGPVTMNVVTSTFSENRLTWNVLANTAGRTDRVAVVGAHLDSVLEGAGVNDNGTGTAAVLEIAEQFAALGVQPRNQVRFAFWGAEESGLLGSEHYVANLTAKQIRDIAANLNFDMLGSPNYVRFVYDGDGDETGTRGPAGSHTIEDVFLDHFAAQGLATEPTAFDGRSDYGPFIAVGIPAGGLFSGAEGIKSAAEAAVYGGTAGIAYDPCYHAVCDTWPANVDMTGMHQLSDAAAHSVLTFAMTTADASGTGRSSGQATENLTSGYLFDGSHYKR